MRDRVETWYENLCDRVSLFAASPWALVLIVIGMVAWTSPLFGVEGKIIDTMMAISEIVAFAFLYLLQRASHRESLANKVKFDEVIRALDNTSNDVIKADDLNAKELEEKADQIKREVEAVEEC